MSRRRCQSLVFLNYGSHNTCIATSISFMPRTLMYLYKSARGISLYPPLLCLTLFGPIRITSSVQASLPLSEYPRPNTGPALPTPSCLPLYPLRVLSAVAESCANAAAAAAQLCGYSAGGERGGGAGGAWKWGGVDAGGRRRGGPGGGATRRAAAQRCARSSGARQRLHQTARSSPSRRRWPYRQH